MVGEVKVWALAIVAVASCRAAPPPAAQEPRATVVTDAAAEPIAPFRRLPPPMLPVDCDEAARRGVVEFCGQRLDTTETHVACHGPNQVSTAALACLPKLQSLTLRDTMVMRLEPLRNLSHLRRLNLSRTRVVDLAPLAGLQSLRELALDETRVVDLSPLAGLRELSKLRLHKGRRVDWSTLSGLPSLTELDLLENDRPDLTTLAPHRSLQTVSVPENITSFRPLAEMPSLRKLVVAGEWLGKVGEGLEAVTQLRELELHQVNLPSLAPLANMANLESLWMETPKVTSLAPLTALTNLTFVGFGDTIGLGDRRQAELASLASLPKLARLTVFMGPHDTSYLRGFTRLEGLALSASGFARLDLGGVAALPKLEVLDLRWGVVGRLAPLVRVKSLTHVVIDGMIDVPSSEVLALRRARPRLEIIQAPKPDDSRDDDSWDDDPEDW